MQPIQIIAFVGANAIQSVDKMITIDTVSFVCDFVAHQKPDGFLKVFACRYSCTESALVKNFR